ncbi:hypothetical protein AB1Y20_008252 [Prymnesium parvum]|uniref:Decapping nuclease n=1 Tax=Prymnesium parvum TaxID=97485 RepID=A0AB34IXF6_PRYPA
MSSQQRLFRGMRVVGTLPVGSPSQYQGPPPRFGKPKEVACFSRDSSRAVHFDRRALRDYTPPPLPVALDDGFASYVPKDNADEPAPLADVFAALAAQKQPVQPGQIVTFRNNLNKLMATPYAPSDDWEIGVHRQPGGVLELQVRETERRQREEAARDERSRRMCYWGYSFEQACTAGRAAAAAAAPRAGEYRVPSPSDPESFAHLYSSSRLEELRRRYGRERGGGGGGGGGVNANEEFCAVMKLELEQVRLFMAAEIDCRAGEPAEYVELKTSKLLEKPRDKASFERHKLLKFWLQSFLAGVPRVVVGFRDEAGVVRKLQAFKTLEIPRLVRAQGVWDPSVCLNFGRVVLEWVVRRLPGAPRLLLRYEPAQNELLLVEEEGAEEESGHVGVKRARIE